jgi:hypothetical protein
MLEINKSRLDRTDVEVSLLGSDKVIPSNHPANPYGDAPVLAINATNKGKKPVYLIQAGFLRQHGKGSFVLVDSEATIRINEGQSHMYRIREDEVRKKGLTSDKYVAYVLTSNGKRYYSHNFLKRFFKLRKIR